MQLFDDGQWNRLRIPPTDACVRFSLRLQCNNCDKSGMPTRNVEESDAERLQRFQANKDEAIAVLDDDGRLVGTVRGDELRL